MSVIPMPYRILIVFGVVIAAFLSGYFKGQDAQLGKDAIAANQQLAKKNAQLVKGAEQHATDQDHINRLAALAGRLSNHPRIVFRYANQDGATRIFLATLNKSLDEVRQGDAEDARRCDQLNIDARQANTSNR